MSPPRPLRPFTFARDKLERGCKSRSRGTASGETIPIAVCVSNMTLASGALGIERPRSLGVDRVTSRIEDTESVVLNRERRPESE